MKLRLLIGLFVVANTSGCEVVCRYVSCAPPVVLRFAIPGLERGGAGTCEARLYEHDVAAAVHDAETSIYIVDRAPLSPPGETHVGAPSMPRDVWTTELRISPWVERYALVVYCHDAAARRTAPRRLDLDIATVFLDVGSLGRLHHIRSGGATGGLG